MRNKLKIIFIFTFIFLLSSCSRNKDNFDLWFKNSVKENINNEIISNENTNSNTVQYELKPLKERRILSSFQFQKNDPFLFDSNELSSIHNELSGINLKGFITISDENYAVVDYLDNEGSITTESIGGKNTNLLPEVPLLKKLTQAKDTYQLVILMKYLLYHLMAN